VSASREGVRVESHGTVVVSGDIDVVSAPQIETALRQAERTLDDSAPVIIDVSAVAFIDSSGLRVLLAASRRSAEAGRRLVLRSPGHAVTRLLSITGTAAMFDLDPPAG
jgi:anti-anti-sigma factor